LPGYFAEQKFSRSLMIELNEEMTIGERRKSSTICCDIPAQISAQVGRDRGNVLTMFCARCCQ
jgi:hypothetical protein